MESRGTPTPLLPSEAGTAEIVGARYCPLEDRVAAHVYYAGQGGMVSVYVLSGPVRIADGWSGTSRGLNVRLLRAVGRYVAVVGGSAADVAAAARAFASTVATARLALQPEGLRQDGSRGTRRPPSRSAGTVRPGLTGPSRTANLLFRLGGAVAQLGARVNGIHEVAGSIPASSTNFHNKLAGCLVGAVPSGHQGGSARKPEARSRQGRCDPSRLSA